jgi:hypothetical protein
MQDTWPCGRPVRLRWRKELRDKKATYYGETWREHARPGLVIDLSERKCRTWDQMIDTLIHEYTHCLLWGPSSLEHDPRCDHHSEAFYAQQGVILNRWHHDHGADQASEYPVR